jgi:choline kinase
VTALDIVILAAGRGSRLAAVGDDKPKWLLEVGGQTIADRQLAALDLLPAEALRSVTVVTGHAAASLAEVPLGPVVSLLHNELYLTYNNWYSVLVALRALPDDARVVVMNGDLCAAPEWLAAFLHACRDTHEGGLLGIDFDRQLTDESMKVSRGDAGELKTIGKHAFPDPVGEYVGLLMATGDVLTAFRSQLEDFLRDEKDAQQWYEGAVGLTAAAGVRWFLWATPGSSWVEIDDLDDLARAEALTGA